MTKSFVIIFLLLLLSIVVSYAQNSRTHKTKPNGISNTNGHGIITPYKITPFSFIETMKKKGSVADQLGVITMINSFPANWVKDSDIDSLMKLINSKEKCNCSLNVFSSFIPSDSANVGGYAIMLINSYRFQKKLSIGSYTCPKTNKQSVDGLLKWQVKMDK